MTKDVIQTFHSIQDKQSNYHIYTDVIIADISP